MRSRSPLTLMEQLVMILVFALAAALCLQVFVFADQTSERNEKTDQAVLLCQNAAEAIKAAGQAAGSMDAAFEDAAKLLGGTFSDGSMSVCYDEEWSQIEQENDCAYRLLVNALPPSVDGLCKASVRLVSAGNEDESLFELTVAWQEVGTDG